MALRAINRIQRSLSRLAWRIEPVQTLLPAASRLVDHLTLPSLSEVTGRYNFPPLQLQAASYGVAARQLHHDLDTYKISVVTGNVRGAGTGCGAFIQLIGSLGQTDLVPVGESVDDGLQRGSTVTFDIQVPHNGLGALRRVYVAREKASSTATGEGWFLEQVNVIGPNHEVFIFPCNAWLGQSDCGDYLGSLERNLLPLMVDHENSCPLPVKGDAVNVLASGVAFPHPEKVIKNRIRGVNMKHFGYGGEDAYFYCTGKNGVFGMGVADGVYMWKELGIDSGTMSRTLMETAMHLVQAGVEDVVQVLQVSARHVESEGVQGSCTACLLTINTELGRMQAATLGDSGFFLIGREPGKQQRQPSIRFRTPQLEHEFGCPYQLGHHEYANKPDDAEFATIPVYKGDIIVMGSDGLLDNLSEVETLEAVTQMQEKGMRPGPMAQALAKLAFDHSLDKHRVTPYSRAATEAFDMVYSGGKPDDITVLVAVLE